ncbi:THAP domain-containing protein 1-like [Microplitis demolitor]|uniref:THAP domain-containing protein 1-like n=1 Tax=Microplitis demolitor TaxID=69319 RepID=UPI0004CD9F8E|nr:THAP domain-containing protein 1-like [Microplitis demolitor]
MGFRCIVSNCRARYKKESSLSFYQLPKDEKMKDRWFSILKLDQTNLKLTTVARICSRHFTDDSFIPRHFGRGRSLRADAVPTLYVGDNNDNKVVRKKKKFTSPNIISVRRQPNIISAHQQANDCNETHSDAEDNPSIIISEPNDSENDSRCTRELIPDSVIISAVDSTDSKNLPRRRKYFEGDFNIDDMNSPKKARFYFQQARNRISLLQTQLQLMKKRAKQLNDKNFKLVMLIENLKTNNELPMEVHTKQDNKNTNTSLSEDCEKVINNNQGIENTIFRYVSINSDDNESTPLSVYDNNDNEQENMNKIFRYVAANSVDDDQSPCSIEQEAKNVIYRYIFSDSDHDYCP